VYDVPEQFATIKQESYIVEEKFRGNGPNMLSVSSCASHMYRESV